MSLRKVTSKSLSMLALSMAALALLSACGGNKTASGVGCPGATGNYANSSLPAGSQWTYQLSGYFLNQSFQYVPYTAAGVFTVDGKGHITSGFDDAFGSALIGTYSISGNGTGNMVVNLTQLNPPQTLTWAVTISATNPGSIYLMEA